MKSIARGAVIFLKIGLLLSLGGFALSSWAARDIRLATTTSTENSGLLAFLLPAFEAQYAGKVQVIAVGTGKAMKLGENGDVDVVLVHSRPDEDRFVAAGHGVNRRDVMYNDFILVGPKSDPAKLRGSKDVIDAMHKIYESKSAFVSRGDDSGTNKMELTYWKAAGIKPQWERYFSSGQGMGEVLTMSASKQAYTLTDRATYGAYRDRTGLEISMQGDAKMFNPYGVIAVNPDRYPDVNYQGAMAFIDWITSTAGQARIAEFKVNGEQLFFPNAKP
jgi:tungstate transport system substrate-binding protein